MTEVDINQLLKDMQRNVDYAFERGTEMERERIFKLIKELQEYGSDGIERTHYINAKELKNALAVEGEK